MRGPGVLALRLVSTFDVEIGGQHKMDHGSETWKLSKFLCWGGV
jgi:hypothetical protein